MQVFLEKDPNTTVHGLQIDLLDFESVGFGRFGWVLDPLDSPTNNNRRSDNCEDFFLCVLLVGFLDLLVFLLGLQNFWDLLDFGYGLVC